MNEPILSSKVAALQEKSRALAKALVDHAGDDALLLNLGVHIVTMEIKGHACELFDKRHGTSTLDDADFASEFDTLVNQTIDKLNKIIEKNAAKQSKQP